MKHSAQKSGKIDFKKVCHYIFELGALKKFAHSGTKLAGVKSPDSIAEHAYRASIIAVILAEFEKADTAKTTLMTLLHDNAEARITDLHKVATRYIDTKEAEKKACEEQVQNLPSILGNHFFSLFKEFEDGKTKESRIAKDADLLETAFQCKEYLDLGYRACQGWFDNIEKNLQTASAKKLFQSIKTTTFTEWWKRLKKLQ